MADTVAVAVQFNACINARNIDGLAELMSDDHVFIDTAGHSISGKRACLDEWREFSYARTTPNIKCPTSDRSATCPHASTKPIGSKLYGINPGAHRTTRIAA